MLDFRKENDKREGEGFKITCNACGKTSFASQGWYCPVCGPGVLAPPIKVTALKGKRIAYVTFRVTGSYTVAVPYHENDDADTVRKAAEAAYHSADFGVLENAEGYIEGEDPFRGCWQKGGKMQKEEKKGIDVTDILWDTDGEDVDLPKEVLIPEGVAYEDIPDYLTDTYEYCVLGYSI